MKKNILRLGLFTLLIIFYALLMPKATFATSIDKIEITVPEPVIGEKLTTDASKIQVKAVDGQSFSIDEITWNCNEYSTSTNQYLGYKQMSDLSKKCNNIDKYELHLSFLVPNTYTPSSNIVVTVNGTTINTQNINELNWGSYGDVNNDGVCVGFKFGKAKIQKEISKIEITTPSPVAGEKLNTDASKFKVKIDGTETLNITNVKWLSEDFKPLNSDVAEEGKKYNVEVNFNVPNKYGVNSNVVITVNGEQIHFSSMASTDFKYATYGDENFDYACVTKLMETKKVVVEDSKEYQKEETKDGTTEKMKKEETKNPKTGDTITKSFIISIIAVVGIALTINNIKKQNK